jgi:hypothetical protein
VRHWKKHQKLNPGERNVVHHPLVDNVKASFGHSIYNLVNEKFVKAMKKDGPVFSFSFFISAAPV